MTKHTGTNKNEPLTPQRFDATVAPNRLQPDRIIWTVGGIAARIGTSPDFVTDTLAKEPGTPIRKRGSRYCVVESELLAFFGKQVS